MGNCGRNQISEIIQVVIPGDGGAEGNRTPDLLIANEALSQLSYSPIAGVTLRMTLVTCGAP
jgi:hypothetical protein